MLIVAKSLSDRHSWLAIQTHTHTSIKHAIHIHSGLNGTEGWKSWEEKHSSEWVAVNWEGHWLTSDRVLFQKAGQPQQEIAKHPRSATSSPPNLCSCHSQACFDAMYFFVLICPPDRSWAQPGQPSVPWWCLLVWQPCCFMLVQELQQMQQRSCQSREK